MAERLTWKVSGSGDAAWHVADIRSSRTVRRFVIRRGVADQSQWVLLVDGRLQQAGTVEELRALAQAIAAEMPEAGTV